MPKRDRSVMDQAHRAIKHKIVTLEAQPGERVDDVSLATELGLSRTPVREALFRLSSEGLVTTGPKGGFTVRPLDIVDISELFEAHIVVARATARLLAVRATESDTAELQKANEEIDAAIESGSPAAISAANAQLHRMEASFARNEHLRGLAYSIHDQGQRLAYLSFGGDAGLGANLTGHFQRTCQDHEEALAAVRDRDPDAAERIAARHVHLFRDRVVEFLQVHATDGVELAGDLPAAPLSTLR